MATQKTLRKATEQGGATGTLVRDVRPSDAFFIEPQLNVFGALMGGPHIGANGKEVTSPKLVKTEPAKSYIVECFTQENVPRTFEVLAEASAAATSVTVSTTNAAYVLKYMLLECNETGDVFLTSAAGDTGTGALAITRYSGAAIIPNGSHITVLGQINGEGGSSIEYVLRDFDNHLNYTTIFNRKWELSRREMSVERYTGPTYSTDRKTARRTIMYDIEGVFIGSKRSASVGAGAATTSRGLKNWSSANGTSFDFEGTVEKSELRQFGIAAGEYNSKMLVCLTSIEAMSVIQSALDTNLQVTPGDLAKGSGLPMSKKMVCGPVTIEFVPCFYYSQAGKEGQGLVFDVEKVRVAELTPMQLWEVMEGEDHTQKASRAGEWYYDAAIKALDGGKGIVEFTGALNYA